MKWWETYNPDFSGMKVIGKGEFPGCYSVDVQIKSEMIWDAPTIAGGGNSGFQAINLVARWGARKIILTGYDFRAPGDHWHGRHPDGMTQTSKTALQVWTRCMDHEAPRLKQRGVEVINATRDTALACFPRMSIGEALERSS